MTALVAAALSVAPGCGAKTGLHTTERDGTGGADGGPSCEPRQEVCNDRDDDCDGVADDGIACFSLNGRPLRPLVTERCGAAWYSYDVPDSQSANPVPDIRRSGAVVVAAQVGRTCPGASLALIADLPQDGSGGELDVDYRITPASAGGLLVGDEPGECMHDPATGTGACRFVWQPCCTDGLLLGSFATDLCVGIDARRPIGVSSLVVLDGPDGVVELPFGEPFEICATVRPKVD